ncbi:hypothetical protein ACFLYH_03450 [Candidatus Dependentiae bacterium]
MKQLEELEKKVLRIIQKNKELQDANGLLKIENEKFRQKATQLENSLINNNKSAEQLESETKILKNSIEDLLDSLGSLETPEKKILENS